MAVAPGWHPHRVGERHRRGRFRDNLRGNTILGRIAQTYIERGELVPDDVTEAMVRERVRQHRAAGVNTLRVQPEGATLEQRLENLGRIVKIVNEES